MKRATKLWLLIAAALILIGLLVLLAAAAIHQWDFTVFTFAEKKEEITFSISETFRDITVESDTEDITFVPSEDGKCRVVFRIDEKSHPRAEVHGGTLEITREAGERKWYEHIALFSDQSPEIRIYLPAAAYGALRVDEDTGDVCIPGDFAFESIDISASTGDVDCRASVAGLLKTVLSTGDIRIADISAGELSLSVSTGRIELRSVACTGDVLLTVSTGKAFLTDLSCRSLLSGGDTGDITLENVLAADQLAIERSTGDVKLENCDAAELHIRTDTGDVTGTLRSDKVFLTQSDTGHIDVPKTVSGGKCELTTDTGDIRIAIK